MNRAGIGTSNPDVEDISEVYEEDRKHLQNAIYKGSSKLTYTPRAQRAGKVIQLVKNGVKQKVAVGLLAGIMFLSLSLTAQADYKFAEGWSTTDTIVQGLVLTTIAVDWAQTRWMARQNWTWDGKQYYEMSPGLSKHPSVSEVDVMIPLGMIAHTVIALVLPPKAEVFGFRINPRRIWQMTWVGVECLAIGNNYGAGVKIEF
jgi:hypothetical protein